MRLTDTLTRELAELRPASGRLLRVYACGPTVYRYAHVGNLRTFLLTDLVRRTAEVVHGWRVQVVQNITDVGHMTADDHLHAQQQPHDHDDEDKVLAQARREGRTALEVARHYEDAFHRDLDALNIRPADVQPRASESIDLMLRLVEVLLDSGHAYVGGDGSVFFDAHSFETYGALSGNRLDDLRPGHRFDGSVDESKKFHADWALWKRAGERRTQLVWDSPWGRGYPGWHVECSAMSLHHLGDTIDLHVGGIDLRFPHHEDERAQSDAAAGHQVVRHWLHAEHLLFEGRKMAKSTGNVVLLPDVSAQGLDPLGVRLAFLEHRYRQQLNLTWDALRAADRTLRRWRDRVAAWAEQPSAPPHGSTLTALHESFDDDLDTPRAVQALRRLERDDTVPAGARFETFAYADHLLGLDLTREVGKPRVSAPLPRGAQHLLDARAEARARKDYDASDRLRDDLAVLGVDVTDTPQGQVWTTR